MAIVALGISNHLANDTLMEMFEERKRVFVDVLKWDIPVLAGRFEVDQFDTAHAVYIIILDEAGRHCGSARLLPTYRPHILDSIFPELNGDEVDLEQSTMEITRFCLSRRLSAGERRVTRNMLVSSFAEYALLNGVKSYVGVAETTWFQQIISFGWDCMPLSLPRRYGKQTLVSFKIHIETDTIEKLRSSGIYTKTKLSLLPSRDAA
jgi:N-acyl-L-homoserine lactone synthetase